MTSLSFDLGQEESLISFLLKSYGHEVFTPGLDRTQTLYLPYKEYFKNLKTKIIIIAGTNGKGQTAHTLGSLLNFENRSFALWTSPHILSIRERFVFGKNGITEEVDYQKLRERIELSDKFLKEQYPSLKVSFYEFLFFVFLGLCKEMSALDYLILEVGLGGRLDAVNHFDCDAAVITSISRDHQSILGARYDLILSEKIAVTRSNKPLFTNFHLRYLNERCFEFCQKNNVNWLAMPKKDRTSYFHENQELAYRVFSYFENHSKLTLKEVRGELPYYKGRREIMTFNGKSLIFIGAHNIDGVRRMLEGFDQIDCSDFLPESLLVSFSNRPINEVEVMLRSLVEYFDEKSEIQLTTFAHNKALDEKSIMLAKNKVNKGMLNFVSDWKSELIQSKSRSILVCGSYYFIGEVQRFIHSVS